MVTETVGDPKALEEIGFLELIKPELVVPMVVFLASRGCELSHQNFACAGVSRGCSSGWGRAGLQMAMATAMALARPVPRT